MEIQPADKRLCVIVGVALVAAAGAGALSLLAFQDWLNDVGHLAPADARRKLVSALAWLSGTSFAMLVLMGMHLWRSGARVRAAARFPLPGMRVIRDTVVLYGADANRRGRIMQSIGAALLLCALALFVAGWYLYASLFARAT
jgi:hypothetical protein